MSRRKLSRQIFIEDALKVHNSKYLYGEWTYENSRNKVEIICNQHGSFNASYDSHVRLKSGCPKCSPNFKKYTIDQIMLKIIKIHGTLYNYILLNNFHEKSKIECKIHGIFEQTLTNHIHQKQGCPHCRSSKGEMMIKKILDTYNISYTQQFKISTCKNLRELSFDFKLLDNIFIEFNGIQHYESVDNFGGNAQYVKQKINDNIKIKFIKENDFRLIIIKYDDDVLEKKKKKKII